MITKMYKTSDGELFESFEAAELHDTGLFDLWMREEKIFTPALVIGAFDQEDKCEHFGSDHDMAVVVFRQLYEMRIA
jgi:hypothetical protein